MKAMTAGILALLTVVFVFFGFGLRASPGAVARDAAPGAEVRMQPVNGAPGGVQVVPVAMAQESEQQAVLVNCGPGSQTLVRPVWLNGQQVSQVECVPAPGAAYGGIVQVRPAVQTVQAYDGQIYPAQIVRPAPEYRRAPRRARQPRRSWQKSALVIGGSSATGAGVGALIGGKKGALIGAALGGGASTIYEATKRR